MTGRGRMIDVSHTVEHGMVTYKGLPAPVIYDYLSREAPRAASVRPSATTPRTSVRPIRSLAGLALG